MTVPVPSDTAFADVEIDHDAKTLRFERALAATPQQVFDAWTKPEQMAEWWDAGGERLSVCEIDARVGGAFRFVSPGRPDMPFVGTYETVDPPHLLVFDAMGAKGKVSIVGDGDGARLTVEIISPSLEHFEQFVEHGVHRGTARTLDNLAAYLRR